MANTLYRSPGDYDDIYHDFTADFDFWRWAAETYSKGLQVGEFACGTGRVTIELAESGFGVYGVDLSLPMLEMARGKLLAGGLLNKVKLSVGNMIDFRTGIFHNLIIVPFTSFAHLIGTEKQLAALRNLRDQLTADGMLIIDVFNPSITHLSAGVGVFTQPIYEKRTDLPSGDVLVRYRTTRYHQSTQLYEWVFYIEVYDRDSMELKRKYTQEATVQVTFPNEWRLLIQSAGLKLVECYGDYGRGMFSDNSPRMILAMERA